MENGQHRSRQEGGQEGIFYFTQRPKIAPKRSVANSDCPQRIKKYHATVSLNIFPPLFPHNVLIQVSVSFFLYQSWTLMLICHPLLYCIIQIASSPPPEDSDITVSLNVSKGWINLSRFLSTFHTGGMWPGHVSVLFLVTVFDMM